MVVCTIVWEVDLRPCETQLLPKNWTKILQTKRLFREVRTLLILSRYFSERDQSTSRFCLLSAGLQKAPAPVQLTGSLHPGICSHLELNYELKMVWLKMLRCSAEQLCPLCATEAYTKVIRNKRTLEDSKLHWRCSTTTSTVLSWLIYRKMWFFGEPVYSEKWLYGKDP